jgi:hypothetical protein
MWMPRRRLNPWLALATVSAMGACGLNPQPDLPNNDDQSNSGNTGGSSPIIDMGGTSSDPTPGLGEGGLAESSGGNPAQTPDAGGASGGDSSGAGGESGGAGDGNAAGQGGAGGGQ